MQYPPPIQKLIDLFCDLPTVGPRTAARFVFYLINAKKEELDEMSRLIADLKSSVKHCDFCFNPFSPDASNSNLCQICQNPTRDKSLLCLVEKETDLLSIEKTKKYKGLYFVLGGNVSALKEEDLKKIRLNELEKRIDSPKNFGVAGEGFKEIIIATNSTSEGESTALYIQRKLIPQIEKGLKITKLGRGLPVGGELEYADEETLTSAFEGRK